MRRISRRSAWRRDTSGRSGTSGHDVRAAGLRVSGGESEAAGGHWSRWDSNPRPLACHASALPTELRPRGMLPVVCCRRPRGRMCAAPRAATGQGRIRTADTGIFSPLLYQLSYLTASCSGHPERRRRPGDRQACRMGHAPEWRCGAQGWAWPLRAVGARSTRRARSGLREGAALADLRIRTVFSGLCSLKSAAQRA